MQPRVSVLMPMRNARRYLSSAINSVLQQSYGEFEFIIVDDGSDDGSVQVVEQIGDHRLKLVRQKACGVTEALNHGLSHAKGEFVARMDADDIALADRFEKQIAFLKQNEDVVAVGSFVERIDEEGLPIALGKWPTDHDEIDQQLLEGRGGLPHPTAMIRHSVLQSVGGYRSEYPVAQDKDLWLRLSEVGRLANIPEPLLQYREHLRSVSTVHQQMQVESVRAAVADAFRRRGLQGSAHTLKTLLRNETANDRRRQWIKSAMRSGNHPTASKHAKLLLLEDYTSPKTWLTLFRWWLAERRMIAS